MTSLEKQIERIIDESDKEHIEVIVEMEHEDDEIDRYLIAASDAISKRRAIVMARALLPPKRELIPKKLATKDLPKLKKSLISRTTLQGIGLANLHPLLESEIVKISLKRSSRRKKKKMLLEVEGPPIFWSSSSALLKLRRDELKKLPKEVSGIGRIYPNRLIRKPPVYKSEKSPEIVEDNKSHSWGIAKTGALACWGAFNIRGEGVKIAILDTGIDPNHPDIKGKIAAFAEFDRKGRIVTEDLADAFDSDGHGTHCAGTIVGGNSSGRWIGMAPEAKILCGLVLKNGVGTDAQILAGIDWAIINGADVINMSLGGLQMRAEVLETYTRQMVNANRIGIPVVVAVGNEGSQTSGSPGNDFFAFTVGATDADDRAGGFSGGRTQIIAESRFIHDDMLPITYSKPEVSAPGVDIYSSVPGGKWEAWNGTSMATPHVAGAMALLLSKKGKLRNLSNLKRVEIIQSLLMSTVKELGEAGQDHRYGFGRIDVLRAMGYAVDLGYW